MSSLVWYTATSSNIALFTATEYLSVLETGTLTRSNQTNRINIRRPNNQIFSDARPLYIHTSGTSTNIVTGTRVVSTSLQDMVIGLLYPSNVPARIFYKRAANAWQSAEVSKTDGIVQFTLQITPSTPTLIMIAIAVNTIGTVYLRAEGDLIGPKQNPFQANWVDVTESISNTSPSITAVPTTTITYVTNVFQEVQESPLPDSMFERHGQTTIASSNHVIAYPSYCPQNNSTGNLMIQATNRSTINPKLGTMFATFILPGSNLLISDVHVYRSVGLSNFSVTNQSSNVLVRTDNDCVIRWTSTGSF